MGGQNGSVADYDYQWYKDSYTPAAIITDSLGNVITSSLLDDQYPGTYYLVARNILTTCLSNPKEVAISDDSIIYPVLRITALAPQTSCDPLQPNAALTATADGGNDDTNPNYQFTWFDGTTASGPSIGNNSSIYGLGTGEFSISVLNIITGCSTSDYYITEDAIEKFRPQVSVASYPKISCAIDDGSVSAEVLNVTGNFNFDWYSGTSASGVPVFNGSPVANVMPGFYTVIAIDQDTTFCESFPVTLEVKDERTYPVIVLSEDNPLTNCWEDKPNAQLSATAGGKVGGYLIEWFNGTDTTGVPDFIGTTYRRLIAQTYTVVITDEKTFCASSESVDVEDATLTPPQADPEVIKHLESCISPDGVLTASVNGDTRNFYFEWFDGISSDNSPDFNGITYRNVDVGTYTVIARDVFTGCVSEDVQVQINDSTKYSEFTLEVVPAHCERSDGSVELVFLNNLPIANVSWYDPFSGGLLEQGSALYNYPTGLYDVVVTTIFGCETADQAEIGTEIFEFNGISANGDGRNDYFEIACITLFPNNTVKIFNRAGQLVYQTLGYDNANNSFKGIGEKGIYLAGQELPDGTYYYIIDKGDRSRPIVGYLELIR